MPKTKNPKSHHPSSKPFTKPLKPKSTPKKRPQPLPPTIPFDPSHRILLVGEGDFSFAASLRTYHACTLLLATCLDTLPALLEKHPQAASHVAALETPAASAAPEDEEGEEEEKEEAAAVTKGAAKILYAVDATRLAQTGGKAVRKARWDRIVFNFPHVGGRTKDVNRQVRYNQELLVAFFRSAMPLLSEPGGAIVVTVFEGEPYGLWNVRDLARHVGLQVGRSFRFQAEAYPGYRHARTLGNIEGGGGWRGEERAARTYVFERKDGEGGRVQQQNKRKRGESDDEEDD